MSFISEKELFKRFKDAIVKNPNLVSEDCYKRIIKEKENEMTTKFSFTKQTNKPVKYEMVDGEGELL